MQEFCGDHPPFHLLQAVPRLAPPAGTRRDQTDPSPAGTRGGQADPPPAGPQRDQAIPPPARSRRDQADPPGMFVDPFNDRVRRPEEMHAASGSDGAKNQKWTDAETELMVHAIRTLELSDGRPGVGRWTEVLKVCGRKLANKWVDAVCVLYMYFT